MERETTEERTKPGSSESMEHTADFTGQFCVKLHWKALAEPNNVAGYSKHREETPTSTG